MSGSRGARDIDSGRRAAIVPPRDFSVADLLAKAKGPRPWFADLLVRPRITVTARALWRFGLARPGPAEARKLRPGPCGFGPAQSLGRSAGGEPTSLGPGQTNRRFV